jgi:hypothetical protein
LALNIQCVVSILQLLQKKMCTMTRVSKPAGRLAIQYAHELSRPADLEIGDTADLEVCGTGVLSTASCQTCCIAGFQTLAVTHIFS